MHQISTSLQSALLVVVALLIGALSLAGAICVVQTLIGLVRGGASADETASHATMRQAMDRMNEAARAVESVNAQLDEVSRRLQAYRPNDDS